MPVLFVVLLFGFGASIALFGPLGSLFALVAFPVLFVGFVLQDSQKTVGHGSVVQPRMMSKPVVSRRDANFVKRDQEIRAKKLAERGYRP